MLRLSGLGLVLAVAIAGCLGRPTPTDTALSDDEQGYLADVLAALRLFDERSDDFSRALAQRYQTNVALFSALAEAGAGTAFEPGLEALERLQPPPRFEDDHEILLDRQRNLVLLDREVGLAIERADLERFVLANMRLAVTSSRSALALEPVVCETVLRNYFGDHPTQSPHYLASALCDRGEIAGGSYGGEVREILRRMTIDVMSRGEALDFFGLVPVVPDDAFLNVAHEVFGEISNSTKAAIREIHGLEPPPQMADNHRHLISYLDEVERIVDRLVAAAIAGDAGNARATDFSELYCRARDEIEPDYRPLVRVHFADAFGFCPGTPEF